MRFTALDIWQLGKATARPYKPWDNDKVRSYYPNRIMPITVGSDYAYYMECETWQGVFVNGSDDVPDWIRNCMWFRFNRYGAAAGFFNPAVGISEIAGKLRNEKPLLVEGFSRGGAMATTIGRLLDADLTVIFGSPKPGGRRYRNWIGELPVYNFQVRKDIVPKLPLIRGCHVGKRIMLNSPHNRLRIKTVHTSYEDCGIDNYEFELEEE